MADYDGVYWKNQIELSKDDLRTFHESGDTITEEYLATETSANGEARVNMFWANVGILKSALYGNPPKPMVTREFQDPEDDVARVAASIVERLLTTGPGGSGADMHEAFKQSIEDRLIPGMGQIWFRYDAEITNGSYMGIPVEQIKDENVPCDYVHWKDFFYSPARFWAEVTWAARRVWMTKEASVKRFGAEKAAQLTLAVYKDGKGQETPVTEKNAALMRTEIFEIWCKTTKTVYWIGKGSDELLDSREDPLELPNFFPCPKPILASRTNKKFIGRADYTMVQDQYRQLNTINLRLDLLIDACRVAGVYDKTAEGVQRMLDESAENKLIPIDQWAAFSEKGGIKGVVDWLPIEVIVGVIEKLREARADVVQQIYELTGISDIMRGVTNARETYGAQKLKAQYSSSRLQLYQQDVGEFVSEAFMIKACIIANHWQAETIYKKSLVEYTPDRVYARQAIQLIKDKFSLLYRINVSSTQMSIPDYNAEKQMRQEYITTMGQFFGQAAPILKEAPAAAPFMLRMLQWAGAAFATSGGVETLFDNFIREVEKKLQQPVPQPGQAEVQAKQALAQMDAQVRTSLAQIDANVKLQITQLQEATKERIADKQIAKDLQIAEGKQAEAFINEASALEEQARDLEAEKRDFEYAKRATDLQIDHIIEGALLEVKKVSQDHDAKIRDTLAKAEAEALKVQGKEDRETARSEITEMRKMHTDLMATVVDVVQSLKDMAPPKGPKSVSITLPDGREASAVVTQEK